MIDNTNLKNDMAQPFSRRHMIMPPATSAQINDAEGTELKTYTVTIDGTEITEDMNLETEKVVPYVDYLGYDNMAGYFSSAKKGNKLYIADCYSSPSNLYVKIFTDGSTTPEVHTIPHTSNTTRFSIFTVGEELWITCNDLFYKLDLEHNTETQVTSATVPFNAESDTITYTMYFEVSDGVIGCNYTAEDTTSGNQIIATSTDGCKTWTETEVSKPKVYGTAHELVRDAGYYLDTTNNVCYLAASGTYKGIYGLKYTSAPAVVLNVGYNVGTSASFYSNISNYGDTVIYLMSGSTPGLCGLCVDTSAQSPSAIGAQAYKDNGSNRITGAVCTALISNTESDGVICQVQNILNSIAPNNAGTKFLVEPYEIEFLVEV